MPRLLESNSKIVVKRRDMVTKQSMFLSSRNNKSSYERGCQQPILYKIGYMWVKWLFGSYETLVLPDRFNKHGNVEERKSN